MTAPARLPFARSERSTVGIEWELALVDADSGDLRQVASTVLDGISEMRSWLVASSNCQGSPSGTVP